MFVTTALLQINLKMSVSQHNLVLLRFRNLSKMRLISVVVKRNIRQAHRLRSRNAISIRCASSNFQIPNIEIPKGPFFKNFRIVNYSEL